jgi:hypothetical protein
VPSLPVCDDEPRTTNDETKGAKPFQTSKGNQAARQAATQLVPSVPVPRAFRAMS